MHMHASEGAMISQKEFDDAMADLVKAEAEIEKLRAERAMIREALFEIDIQYQNQNISHRDYRILAKQAASAALARLPAPPEDK
jgi:hypothetical protein